MDGVQSRLVLNDLEPAVIPIAALSAPDDASCDDDRFWFGQGDRDRLSVAEFFGNPEAHPLFRDVPDNKRHMPASVLAHGDSSQVVLQNLGSDVPSSGLSNGHGMNLHHHPYCRTGNHFT